MERMNICGFCKNNQPILRSVSFSVGPLLWYVECGCGHRAAMGYSEDDAVRHWNRIHVRADDAVVEYLEKQQEVDFRTDKGA